MRPVLESNPKWTGSVVAASHAVHQQGERAVGGLDRAGDLHRGARGGQGQSPAHNFRTFHIQSRSWGARVDANLGVRATQLAKACNAIANCVARAPRLASTRAPQLRLWM